MFIRGEWLMQRTEMRECERRAVARFQPKSVEFEIFVKKRLFVMVVHGGSVSCALGQGVGRGWR